ncbi:MAG: hypothetical protein HZT41_09360 [Dechloromonas sp.]|nr:MAG: hypothetical protein HZT41_09360 [Dechloromonas sp.]
MHSRFGRPADLWGPKRRRCSFCFVLPDTDRDARERLKGSLPRIHPFFRSSG